MLITVERLQPFVEAIFRHAGSDDREAGLISANLVAGNLAGHDSHGVGLVPLYVRALAAGNVKANTKLRVVRDSEWIVVLDAGRVAEEGTHEALTEKGGLYARLHALQFRD